MIRQDADRQHTDDFRDQKGNRTGEDAPSVFFTAGQMPLDEQADDEHLSSDCDSHTHFIDDSGLANFQFIDIRQPLLTEIEQPSIGDVATERAAARATFRLVEVPDQCG